MSSALLRWRPRVPDNNGNIAFGRTGAFATAHARAGKLYREACACMIAGRCVCLCFRCGNDDHDDNDDNDGNDEDDAGHRCGRMARVNTYESPWGC